TRASLRGGLTSAVSCRSCTRSQPSSRAMRRPRSALRTCSASSGLNAEIPMRSWTRAPATRLSGKTRSTSLASTIARAGSTTPRSAMYPCSRKYAASSTVAIIIRRPPWTSSADSGSTRRRRTACWRTGRRPISRWCSRAIRGRRRRSRLRSRPHGERFRPIGVLAVLGPFNFPVHLPNGHILPAIACGNSVVFRPSEIAPHAAEVYARCLEEAGVPPGVFNLVQGGPAVGAALSAHGGVDGVLFTGSWAVGQAIQKANLGQTKLLALEMGGKNAAIVLADADFDKAVYDVLFSAFVSAGQRCTAASRAIVVGDARTFAKRIAQLARQLSIGHPLDGGVFMGPLASPASLDKFEKGLAAAGEEVVLASRRVRPRGLDGCYVTPSVHFVQNSRNTP